MYTVNNTKFIEDMVEQYGPQLPIDQLVLEINRLYHGFEAEIYDAKHPEIYEQLPGIWREMSKRVTEYFGSKMLRILDFGCGTGFEAQQLLQNIPTSSIGALTCYDPSPEMLEKCRRTITPLFPSATFFSSLEEVLNSDASYSLLVTNSVLHHLPDVLLTIGSLLPFLDTHAIWLAGHEPSLRFYKNTECVENFEAYLRERRRLPDYYTQLLKLIIRVKGNPYPYAKTAREAVRTGLFARQPPSVVIDRIVDFHVAHSTEEVSAGRGFDVFAMQEDFQASWKLIWLKTYGFMGSFFEGELKGRWARSCQELAHRFPDDGANFCTIWQRV